MGCSGLLSKLSQQGCSAHVMYLAVDGFRHYGLGHETTYAERVEEIEAVAGLLGFSYEISYANQGLIEKLDTLPKRDLVLPHKGFGR